MCIILGPFVLIFVVVSDLSLTIAAGQSLLIVGGSSAGKTSILRILRGLWPYSEGKVTKLHPPGCQGVYYVPQKPILTFGTLREQVSSSLRCNQVL